MRMRKNFSTKKRFGQFLIWIRIQIRDSNPDSNLDSNPDPKPDPDPQLTSGRIRIRNRIRNICFGSATLELTRCTVTLSIFLLSMKSCGRTCEECSSPGGPAPRRNPCRRCQCWGHTWITQPLSALYWINPRAPHPVLRICITLMRIRIRIITFKRIRILIFISCGFGSRV